MKQWNYIEILDEVGYGISVDGYERVEMNIEGWNDDEEWEDLETLVTVEAIKNEDLNRIDVIITYHFDDLKSNVTVRGLVNKLTKDILDHI
ncbi:hypothetical protein [Solibacillus sp. NPDC093137]|uniref:hypothetical protein n=1 Tax=Solibacillus sp. NPDC093137 TaxID=3390678 RepID=UPI003D0543C9